MWDNLVRSISSTEPKVIPTLSEWVEKIAALISGTDVATATITKPATS